MKDRYSYIASLLEREKELSCLYKADELLRKEDIFSSLFELVSGILLGWQFPSVCSAEIVYGKRRFRSPGFEMSNNFLESHIIINDEKAGFIKVFYPDVYNAEKLEFLPEEQLLLNAISRRISDRVILSEKRHEKSNEINVEHWQWRYKMAEIICERTDFKKLGICSIYLAGSTKSATSGPASDIDLIVIHKKKNTQLISACFDGWSHCLAVWNQNRTGILVKEGLLDVHLIHESEILKDNSFATMLRSKNNSAKLLKSI